MGAGLEGRRALERLRLRWGPGRRESEATRVVRRSTSARSWCISVSKVGGWEWERAETDGAATAVTLSAISARVARSIASPVEARTILTLGGSRCKNNSRRKVELASAAWSPRSCCMRRSSWVGFLSPSSSPRISCWSLRCSEAAVRLMSSALRVS